MIGDDCNYTCVNIIIIVIIISACGEQASGKAG